MNWWSCSPTPRPVRFFTFWSFGSMQYKTISSIFGFQSCQNSKYYSVLVTTNFSSKPTVGRWCTRYYHKMYWFYISMVLYFLPYLVVGKLRVVVVQALWFLLLKTNSFQNFGNPSLSSWIDKCFWRSSLSRKLIFTSVTEYLFIIRNNVVDVLVALFIILFWSSFKISKIQNKNDW